MWEKIKYSLGLKPESFNRLILIVVLLSVSFIGYKLWNETTEKDNIILEGKNEQILKCENSLKEIKFSIVKANTERDFYLKKLQEQKEDELKRVKERLERIKRVQEQNQTIKDVLSKLNIEI